MDCICWFQNVNLINAAFRQFSRFVHFFHFNVFEILIEIWSFFSPMFSFQNDVNNAKIYVKLGWYCKLIHFLKLNYFKKDYLYSQTTPISWPWYGDLKEKGGEGSRHSKGSFFRPKDGYMHAMQPQILTNDTDHAPISSI